MRNNIRCGNAVAVTEGDKTEAERVFGASINTWAVNELVAAYDKVKDVKVTVKADIPFMLKGMVAGPLQDGVEKIADVLSQIPYV